MPEIHTMENCDLLKSIIHSRIIKLSVIVVVAQTEAKLIQMDIEIKRSLQKTGNAVSIKLYENTSLVLLIFICPTSPPPPPPTHPPSNYPYKNNDQYHLKSRSDWFNNAVMHPKGADSMTNSVDPDLTAPIEAVRSGSALFSHISVPMLRICYDMKGNFP